MISTDDYLDAIDADQAVAEAVDTVINDWFADMSVSDPYMAAVMLQGPTDGPENDDAATAAFTRPSELFLRFVSSGLFA